MAFTARFEKDVLFHTASALEHEDIGSYSTFGIQVLLVEETVLDLVSDVSTDPDEVQRICELCTERQITPKHILDVVRNHLDEEPDILPV